MRPTSLSPHFSWSEVEASDTARRLGIVNTLPIELLVNVARTAQMLECVRAVLGEPILLSSWYRCPELNKAVGSSSSSVHPKGLAGDFTPARTSLDGAFNRIIESGLPYDQLIIERTSSGSAWIHIGLSEGPPRRQALRASGETLGGPMAFTRVAVN